jgi:uncharacterized protein
MALRTIDEELPRQLASPTTAGDRIASLDVLRGFALLGILLANIQDFASPTGILHDIPLDVVSQTGAHHALDVAVMTAQWIFVEGKMRALFGLLFGAGTVLLLDRIDRRAGPELAADIFHRRNMWLLFFGILHGVLIWNGDILLFYGSLALLALYPLRKVTANRLITIGLGMSLVGGTLGISNAMDLPSALRSAALQESAADARAEFKALSAEQQSAIDSAIALRKKELQSVSEVVAVGRGGYLISEPENAKGEAEFVSLVFRSGWIFEVLGTLIAGMGFYKKGFLSARLSSRFYLTTAVVGYAITSAIVLIGLNHSRRFGFSDAVTTKWMFLPYGVQQIAGMLANASVLLVLVRHRILMPVQRGLAAVGRTALSNYLLTSLACQFVFKWGPWKLYGRLEYYQDIYVVACVWTFNIIASLIWLRYFSFGPFEWLWRSLTYWRPQRFITE